MWQSSGRPCKVSGFSGYSSFLHHVRSQNANILSFENAFISFITFLCDQSKINSVYKKPGAFLSFVGCTQGVFGNILEDSMHVSIKQNQ